MPVGSDKTVAVEWGGRALSAREGVSYVPALVLCIRCPP